MIREDQLSIRLSSNEEDKNNLRVDIVSTRKSDLAQIFVGKTPMESLPMIPRLYSICGMAHSYAAIQACQSLDDSRPSAIHEALCLNEMLREHVLHIALHWTRQIGTKAPREQMPVLVQAFEAISLKLLAYAQFDSQPKEKLEAAFLIAKLDRITERLDALFFGHALKGWKDLKTSLDLVVWCGDDKGIVVRMINQSIRSDHQDIATIEPAFLPNLSKQDWYQLLQRNKGSAFCDQPNWHDEPHETGSLQRQKQHPLIRALMPAGKANLLARQTARILDLLGVMAQLRDQLKALDGYNAAPILLQKNGSGVGVVETARGRLVHAIDLQDGLIRHWCILAPTEWNFHPKGAAAQSLSRLIPGPGLEEQARQIMLAIDPCIAFDLLDATGSGKGASYA
jgi:coenzyme F420-reducing hydrogenase alpha subunit